MLDLSRLNKLIQAKYEGVKFTIDKNFDVESYKIETNILSKKKRPISAWISIENARILEGVIKKIEFTGEINEVLITQIIRESLPMPYSDIFAQRTHTVAIQDINEVVNKKFKGVQFVKDSTVGFQLETSIITKKGTALSGTLSNKNRHLINEILSSRRPLDASEIIKIIRESLPHPYGANLENYVGIDINEEALMHLKELFDITIREIKDIYTKLKSILNDKDVERYISTYYTPYKFNKDGMKKNEVLLEDKYSIENYYCKCICNNPLGDYLLKVELKDENISYLKESYEYFNSNIDFFKRVGDFISKEKKLKKEYSKKLNTYCSAGDTHRYLSYTFDVDIKKIIIGDTPYDIDNNTIEILEKHYNKIVEKCKQEHDIKVTEAKNALSGEDDYYVLNLVNICKDKGLTTYIDILKGSKRAKILENNFDKLDEYSKLSKYKKDEIESKILNLIHRKYLMRVDKRASQGYYYEALSLTSLSKDILNRFSLQDFNNKQKSDIECLEFLAEAQKYESFVAISDYYNITPLKQDSDIFEIIRYIKECKKNYKNDIDVLVELLGKAIDSKFIPLIQLNALSESGIAKDTLLNLAKVMG